MERQFGMLSCWAREHVLRGVWMPSWEGALLKVSGQLKSIVKRRILGVE